MKTIELTPEEEQALHGFFDTVLRAQGMGAFNNVRYFVDKLENAKDKEEPDE